MIPELPHEIILVIAKNCAGIDLIMLAGVSPCTRFLLTESSLWRERLSREFYAVANDMNGAYNKYVEICSVSYNTIVTFSLPNAFVRTQRGNKASDRGFDNIDTLTLLLMSYLRHPTTILQIVEFIISKIYEVNRKNAKLFTEFLADYFVFNIEDCHICPRLVERLYKRVILFEPFPHGVSMFKFKRLGRRHKSGIKIYNNVAHGAILHMWLNFIHDYMMIRCKSYYGRARRQIGFRFRGKIPSLKEVDKICAMCMYLSW